MPRSTRIRKSRDEVYQLKIHTFDIAEIRYERYQDFKVCHARRKRTGDFTTLVGKLPNVVKNSQVKVRGSYINHPRYGRQFDVSKVLHIYPNVLLPNGDTFKKTVENVIRDVSMRRPWIIYDLETTGFNPYFDAIVEISAIRIDPNTREQTEFSRLCLPPILIPEEVIAVHHITNDMVANEKTEKEVLADFHRFCYDDGCVPLFIGYNSVQFDNYFMQIRGHNYEINFPIQKSMDVMRLSQSLYKKYHTLTCLCTRLGLIRGGSAHRGSVDVYDTLVAMCLLIQKNGLDMKAMIRRTHPCI